MPRSRRQTHFQAQQVRFKDTLCRVIRVPGNKDKLQPVAQTHGGKLSFRLLPPVVTVINGNTVHPVKKIPGIRVHHNRHCLFC